MCGIYVTNITSSKEEVKNKIERIQFRGPNYTGIKKVDNLTFAHLRLAILDLDERSNQPMEIDEFTIVFNGEIYNFEELRKKLELKGHKFLTTGDTEVLLRGYIEWGKNVIDKANGMFSLVIYNSITKQLFCSRDRLGVKPFYYYWKDGVFEICSQLAPLKNGKKINNDAISIYLECAYIPSPFSIYEDVYKLPPGYNLEIDMLSGTQNIYSYWDLQKVDKTNLNYEDSKNKLHELLKDAVKIRLKSDVPYGTFLSGGVDSALISSIASKTSPIKIKTFTIGFENPLYDESKVAKQFSEIIDSDHTEVICKPKDFYEMLPTLLEVYDEPFADSSALPSLLLNKITKKYVTMALSGDGGDESFLGYNHFDAIVKYKKIFLVPLFFRKIISHLLGLTGKSNKISSIRRLLEVKDKNAFIEGTFIGYNSLLKNRKLGWMNHYRGYRTSSTDILQKTADLNIKLWLENDSNVKVDRASMASSVEVRSPLLDYRIIEFARELPISYRYNNGRKKHILKEILKEYIPEEVFNQPKKGFSIPIGHWIRDELKEEFSQSFSDNLLNKIPNLDISKFKKMYEDHLLGKGEYSSYIWRVYILSKWLQKNDI
ncbi:asparagine synthase (glutamine-hydrolyzing) [Flavicella sediminum]|uniref:asparagine synthase (glutamine-hydrolyzing) n=1 Tax=Flavicella sediminum TaxID=2585141 RepID=UPI0011243BA8|nr:asparagine synthase (glutamine-hydrolyzing) [Flavicella sediminum]